MTIRRGFLHWGVFLVCLGLVPLAVQLGLLDNAAVAELIRFWPLILIGIGLGLLLRFTPYALVGGVIVAMTSGLLVGGLLSGGATTGGAVACSGGAVGPTINRSGSITTPTAALNAEITCAEFELDRASGQAWTVDVATGGADPTIAASGSSLNLISRQGLGPFSGSREIWHVSMPTEATLEGSMTFNAARAELRLGGGAVGRLNATFNGVDGLLDLADASGSPSLDGTLNATSLDLVTPPVSFRGDLTLNASSLNVCTLPGTALRIDYEQTLGSNNFAAAGLVQNGDLWLSPGYESAATQVDLEIGSNVSTMTLNPEGGCQ